MRTTRACVLALALLAASGCALGMDPGLARLIQQRTDNDCVIAALATYGEWSYDEVDGARVWLGLEFSPGGLSETAAMDIARKLGRPLERITNVNPVMDAGVLWTKRTGPLYHAVALKDGWIYDPMEDRPSPWVLWFAARPDAVITSLLRPIP